MFNAYLMFGGNCRDAFTRYHEIFGGELFLLPMSDMPSEGNAPPEMQDMIIHAALRVGDGLVMASDDPTDDFQPARGMHVSVTVPDEGEAKRVFDALAEGGEVTQALEQTFFSPAFGMVTDRFGTPWMVNTESAEQPA
jgi:PhnB protein